MAQPTAYQRVVDEYDVTEAGVTSLDYLSFDGSDDGMATASIDFTATDEMSVFAGVEKESDAAITLIAENNDAAGTAQGVFQLRVNTSSRYEFGSRGSLIIAPQTSDNTYAVPSINVLSGLAQISSDVCILRIDGSQVDTSSADQGSGNYRNGPIYLGSRANTSAFFDGKIFGLIVRGAASTANEISNTETYLAAKSGVTLP